MVRYLEHRRTITVGVSRSCHVWCSSMRFRYIRRHRTEFISQCLWQTAVTFLPSTLQVEGFTAAGPTALPSFLYISTAPWLPEKVKVKQEVFSFHLRREWDLINCSDKFHAFNLHPGKIYMQWSKRKNSLQQTQGMNWVVQLTGSQCKGQKQIQYVSYIVK